MRSSVIGSHEDGVRHPDPRENSVDGVVKHAGKPALEGVVCHRCVEAVEGVRALGVEEIGSRHEAERQQTS